MDSQENIEKTKSTQLPNGCIPDFHPQRQRFDFDEISIDTLFDSANLAKAEKFKDFHYHLTIANDAYLSACQTTNKTWFYFRVTNIRQEANYVFTIKNMNKQIALFDAGLTPIFKAIPSSPEWSRIRPQTILLKSLEVGIEVTFSQVLTPTDSEVFIAFTYPWSYTDDQEQLNKLELQFKGDKEIYFHREVLNYSRENRRMELLTISSHSNKIEEREERLTGLFPHISENPRPFKFTNKKYVLISARVHPGETAASYTFNGLLKFLLDKEDPRSKAFRENFVILLIPMLNPDGVSRGHYRMDTHGLNLNRFYLEPTQELHPTIYAAKKVIMDLHNRGLLYLYCDLHAHATIKGCFVYANPMELRDQVECNLFPKLLSLNSECFEYEKCLYPEKTAGKEGKVDKDGAGRAALYQETNNPRCYTLECNYAAGKFRNILSTPVPTNQFSEKDLLHPEEAKLGDVPGPRRECLDPYTDETFEELGAAIGPTLLDMIDQNPLSRLPTSPYKSLKNVKLHIALSLMKTLRFRFDPFVKKINPNPEANIEALKTFIEEGVQVEISNKTKSSEDVNSKKKILKKSFAKSKKKEVPFELVEEKENIPTKKSLNEGTVISESKENFS